MVTKIGTIKLINEEILKGKESIWVAEIQYELFKSKKGDYKIIHFTRDRQTNEFQRKRTHYYLNKDERISSFYSYNKDVCGKIIGKDNIWDNQKIDNIWKIDKTSSKKAMNIIKNLMMLNELKQEEQNGE